MRDEFLWSLAPHPRQLRLFRLIPSSLNLLFLSSVLLTGDLSFIAEASFLNLSKHIAVSFPILEQNEQIMLVLVQDDFL